MLESARIDPEDVAVWIFDLDNTLYPAHCDLGAQLGRRMGEFVAPGDNTLTLILCRPTSLAMDLEKEITPPLAAE